MTLSSDETDYLIGLVTTQLFNLLARVTRWQTHSLSQTQYDQQVHETLIPEYAMLSALMTKLAPSAGDQDQVGAVRNGLEKLARAQTYQLTADQLNHANERRFNRHRR